jgi:prepilin-type N-terminal cleavage/methylation domain-containing protein
MKKIFKSCRGFTITELLIVIVVIGILTSSAIPKFKSVKDDAEQAACRSNLKSLAVSEQMFFVENNSFTANSNDLDIYLRNASTLQCMSSSMNYILSSDGTYYSVVCPSTPSHGNVADGVPSW